MGLGSTSAGRRPVGIHQVAWKIERFIRNSHDRFCSCHILSRKRKAMCGMRVSVIWRRETDVGAQHEQTGLTVWGSCYLKRTLESVEIFANFTELHDIPSV